MPVIINDLLSRGLGFMTPNWTGMTLIFSWSKQGHICLQKIVYLLLTQIGPTASVSGSVYFLCPSGITMAGHHDGLHPRAWRATRWPTLSCMAGHMMAYILVHGGPHDGLHPRAWRSGPTVPVRDCIQLLPWETKRRYE